MISVAKLSNKPARTKKLKPNYVFVLPDNLMGVEVEVDMDTAGGTYFPAQENLGYWRKHHDGSLVNGYEYTLTMPMAGGMLAEAIAQLYAPPSAFTRTFTGSTHIHIDMLEEDVNISVLRTLVLLVYTLEPMLYAAGDSSREWCGYANSLKSAEPLLLSTLFSDEVESNFQRVYRRGGTLGRYYGLNMAALTDYGSLEFRYFPTATTDTELVRWINLVQSFKKAAMAIGSPDMLKNIINEESSFNNMLNEFFADFQVEREALNGWRSVHSFFLKAGIISKDNQLQDAGTFRGDEVFKDNKFSSIIGEITLTLPIPDPSTLYTVHLNGVVPSRAQDGDVLVYNSTPYVYFNNEWFSAVTPNYRNIELSPRMMAGLYNVLTENAHLLHEHTSQRLREVLIVGELPSAQVYDEEPAYDVDEDDIEDF